MAAVSPRCHALDIVGETWLVWPTMRETVYTVVHSHVQRSRYFESEQEESGRHHKQESETCSGLVEWGPVALRPLRTREYCNICWTISVVAASSPLDFCLSSSPCSVFWVFAWALCPIRPAILPDEPYVTTLTTALLGRLLYKRLGYLRVIYEKHIIFEFACFSSTFYRFPGWATFQLLSNHSTSYASSDMP